MAAKKKPSSSDNSRPLIPNPNYKKPKPASAADFRMKEEADKRKMKRTDAQGRTGMGASNPKKSKDFWDSPAGKVALATNPLLALGVVVSAGERAVRKKVKGKKWAGDPGLKPGE